jgi:hypothetical protein
VLSAVEFLKAKNSKLLRWFVLTDGCGGETKNRHYVYMLHLQNRGIDQKNTIVPLRILISPITSGSDIPPNADRTSLIKCEQKTIEIHPGDNASAQIRYEILIDHLNYMKSLI